MSRFLPRPLVGPLGLVLVLAAVMAQGSRSRCSRRSHPA
jgi:hypothetical protein